MWIALPIGLVMVALAQNPLSAARSATMLGLFMGARLLGRSHRSLDIWAAVGLVMVLDQPRLTEQVGFQLSFSAVGALLALTQRKSPLINTMWTSLVASWATAPIIAWHFGIWIPSSPLCNAVIVPIASGMVVPMGLMGLFLAPITTTPLEFAAEAALAMR